MSENTSRKPMTDAEIDVAIAGEVCAACGKYKRKGQAFCATDAAALSLPSRWAIDRDRYLGFRSALRHLELHRERKNAIAEAGWKYRSQDELEAAGFRLSRHARCEVPRPDSDRVPAHTCGARISIWITPNGKRLALDDRTLRPHRPDCADPGYFTRRLATAESRKRRTRRTA